MKTETTEVVIFTLPSGAELRITNPDPRDVEVLRAALAEQQAEPIAWLVLDEKGQLMHATGWRQAAHDHINEAISEFDLSEAAQWRVVPAYAGPSAQREQRRNGLKG